MSVAAPITLPCPALPCPAQNYLHTCRPPVIHRDLKTPNLLVDKDLTIKASLMPLPAAFTVLAAPASGAGSPPGSAAGRGRCPA
jgi:hypothetical protein